MLKNFRLPRVSLSILAIFALPLAGCLGDQDGHRSSASSDLQVTVSPSQLSVPAGGGGYVTITATRPVLRLGAYRTPLTLNLEQAPVGVNGSGTIAGDQSTGTLTLWVDAAVAPQSIQGLRIKATGGGLAAIRGFDLTIAPPLPPGHIRADLVQASGGLQKGGTLTNTPLAQEPVAATPASDAARVQATRHGFHPNGPIN